MNEKNKDFYPMSNWGLTLINKVIHPFTIVFTPIFALVLLVYFIVRSFTVDVSAGVRSFAGALLPLVLVTFIFMFRSHLLETLFGRLNVPVSAGVSFIVGLAVMGIARVFASIQSVVPVAELLLSGSFSLLVFSYIHIPEKKILAYYYGMVFGFLTYIVFFGFPISLK